MPGLTACRQLFNSSTLLEARQLDRSRQNSTDLDTPAHAVSLDLPRRARQLLDSYSTGSTGKALTAPRQRPRQRLDGASTACSLLLRLTYNTRGPARRARAGAGCGEGGWRPDPRNASQSETSNYDRIVICDCVDSIRHTRTYSARRYVFD